MLQVRTVQAMLASAAIALAIATICLDSALADSQQSGGVLTSGYSLLRVPQPQAKGPLVGGPAGASTAANSSAATSPPTARVPFPVPPKSTNAGGASAAGASTQGAQPSAGPYVPASKRQKTRRMPLGW